MLTYLQSTTHGALDKVSVFSGRRTGTGRKRQFQRPYPAGERRVDERGTLVSGPAGERGDPDRRDSRFVRNGRVEGARVAGSETCGVSSPLCRACTATVSARKNPDDIVVKSDSYQTVSFQAQAGKEKEGTVKIEFHQSDKNGIAAPGSSFSSPLASRRRYARPCSSRKMSMACVLLPPTAGWAGRSSPN